MPLTYVFGWITALAMVALGAARHVARHPAETYAGAGAYARFLLDPLRLATLALATAIIAAAAPYSGDPTWDAVDSVLCGVATYATAPWAIATLYRELRARRASPRLWAAAVLFFVPCWTYELYIWARDGHYPPGWAPNLVLTGIIALCAGLFWNLGPDARGRASLTFRDAAWPPTARATPRALLAPMALLAAPVLLMVLAFVYDGTVGLWR